ncbi:Hypothetical_protein [Hexamita inflata]|uniref:Hypothetical_protein n=1 Tax=Hexamita inflata TaxID=28002 RepID=A0AA86NEW4_9EUKA|nr:Hypothetical protein HINF_LOCUS6052 [Hexamita inflata]
MLLIYDGGTKKVLLLKHSATNLAEPHLRKLDATRNEKCKRMNPASTTLNKAGIPAVSLQLLRRTSSLSFYIKQFEMNNCFYRNYNKFNNNQGKLFNSLNEYRYDDVESKHKDKNEKMTTHYFHDRKFQITTYNYHVVVGRGLNRTLKVELPNSSYELRQFSVTRMEMGMSDAE